MPGYSYTTDLLFLLTLLKVRFKEKNGFYFFNPIGKILEKTKLRLEKRFEAKVLIFQN